MRTLIVLLLRFFLGLLGLVLGRLQRRAPGRVFCFFATPGVGGAERVHADIVAALADAKPVVYFTEVSPDRTLLPQFAAHADCRFIHGRKRRPLREYFRIGLAAALVNRAPGAVALGAFSHFYYDMLPFLNPRVRCVDLVHNFGVGFEHYSLRLVPRLDVRVVIAPRFADELRGLYNAVGLEPGHDGKLRVILNGVHVPAQLPELPARQSGPLRVLYVGRNSPEKRVALVGRIAQGCREAGINAEFTLVGEVESGIAPEHRPLCRFTGLVADTDALTQLYRDAHVVLITSTREGFPVSVMEAMAQGVVPLCTRVGGIPGQIRDGVNGVLVDPQPDEAVVEQCVTKLGKLAAHRGMVNAMGRAAHAHALEHFAMERFAQQWREVLLPGAAP